MFRYMIQASDHKNGLKALFYMHGNYCRNALSRIPTQYDWILTSWKRYKHWQFFFFTFPSAKRTKTHEVADKEIKDAIMNLGRKRPHNSGMVFQFILGWIFLIIWNSGRRCSNPEKPSRQKYLHLSKRNAGNYQHVVPSRLIFVGCRQFCHEKLVNARVNRYTFSNIHFNKTSAITFTKSCSLIYLLHARYFINPQILESQLNVPQTLFGWAVVNTQQGTPIWNRAPWSLTTDPQEQVFMQPLHKNATLSKEAVRALKPCWLNVVPVIYNDCIVATTSIHESNCDKRAVLYGHFAPKKAQYQSSRSPENSFCRSIISWWRIGWWRILMVAKWP